jgi:hypothetical protein
VAGRAGKEAVMQAMAEAAEPLVHNTLAMRIHASPRDRTAEAYLISRSGHVGGKVVLVR